MYKWYLACVSIVYIAMVVCLIPDGPRIVYAIPSEAEVEQTRQSVLSLANHESAIPAGQDEAPVRRSLGFFEVTAYCPCEKCCGNHADGVTASGKLAVGKFVAADGIIPFYKALDVPEYGVVPVLDRGGAIRGKKLDVFFPTHDEALKWGRRVIEIFCWVEE